jgi:hypothetical protein
MGVNVPSVRDATEVMIVTSTPGAGTWAPGTTVFKTYKSQDSRHTINPQIVILPADVATVETHVVFNFSPPFNSNTPVASVDFHSVAGAIKTASDIATAFINGNVPDGARINSISFLAVNSTGAPITATLTTAGVYGTH